MYLKRLLIGLLAFTSLLTACSTPAKALKQGLDPDPTSASLPELHVAQDLQQALDNGLENYGGKGISAAIIVPGNETWTGVSGVSHGATPITTETVFDAGSTHKIFTAAIVLQLAEEGTLSLDDPIQKWLPAYPHVDNNITIRQLLNHTAGVFDMVRHPDYWGAMTEDISRIWTPDEILTNFLQEPYFPKGEGWHYSTPGYILLRLIVEEATQTDLATVYRTRLWDPLDLSNTYLAIYEDLPENTAHGWFDLDKDGAYEEISQFEAFNSSTAGAVFTTAEDLATWSLALFHERRVLSQASLEQALTFQATTPDEPLLVGYGLGVVKFSPDLFNNMEIWGHSGNAAGFAAASLYLPDYGVSIGLMVNTHAGEAMMTLNDLLTILTEELR